MNWLQNYRKTAIIVGISLAVPMLVLLYFWGGFWVLRLDQQNEIDRLEPRIARLSGLVESEEVLKASARKVKSKISSLVYPQTDDIATVAAALQTNVRELIAATGLTVSNSRILPAQETEAFDRVGLSLTVSGDMAALDATLAEIAAFSPLLLVESIDVRPNRSSRRGSESAAQTVTASLQLLSLRALPKVLP